MGGCIETERTQHIAKATHINFLTPRQSQSDIRLKNGIFKPIFCIRI